MKNTLFVLIFFCFNLSISAQRQNQWRNYLDPSPKPYLDLDFALNGQNLWIPTYGGLVHFNTVTEKHTIYQPDSCAIKGVQIKSVYPDSMGGVWFSTNVSGLQYFDGTTFRWFLTKNNGESLNAIRKIQLDKQGRVWMLNQTTDSPSPKAEILMFDGQNWTSYLRDSLLFENEFAVDKDDVCWFDLFSFTPYYNHKLASFDSRNGQIMRFDSTNSAIKLTTSKVSIRTDNFGDSWMSYSDPNKVVQLHKLTLNGFKNFKLPTNLAYSNGLNLSFSNEKAVYLTDKWYIYRFKDSIWTTKTFLNFSIEQYIPLDSVNAWAIGFDLDIYSLFRIGNNTAKNYSFLSEKSLTYNLFGRGVYTIFGNLPQNNNLHFQYFTFDGRQFKRNNLSGKQATFDGDSLLWMTEYSDARFFDFRTNSQVIVPSAIYRGINPYKILADKKSNKWVLSSDFTKFYRIDKNRVFTILDFSFPSRNLIRDFAIDSSGNVFVASDSGLLKRDVRTENWAFVPLKDSVRKNLTRITIDEGNNIWFDVNSTCYQFSEINGLKLLDGQNVSLPIYDNFFPTGNFVTYRNNKWWFAARNGLVSFDGQNYKTYNAVNSPMPTNYITSLFTDKLGNLWMNHKYGLTVFNENSLVDLRTFVKEISQKYGIKSQVSPNPLSKNGILSFENPERKLFELTIFDANGKTVIYQTATENRFIIQNQNLMNGIYFYNLKNNAETGFGKFVVQH